MLLTDFQLECTSIIMCCPISKVDETKYRYYTTVLRNQIEYFSHFPVGVLLIYRSAAAPAAVRDAPFRHIYAGSSSIP